MNRLDGRVAVVTDSGQGQSRSRQVKTSQDKSQGSLEHVTGKARQVQNLETEAEGCFLRAVKIAHEQGAKSLELRAGMSLARLLGQQGRKRQARNLLADIYGWFTEGFDTVDLQEAQTLLEELQ
jgi:predicted ATPase